MKKSILIIFVGVVCLCASGNLVYAQTTGSDSVVATSAQSTGQQAAAYTEPDLIERIAQFSLVKGAVYVIKQGKEENIPAQLKMQLFAGDKIITKSKSRAEITLDDNSIIRLKENATLEIQDLNLNTQTKEKKSISKILVGKLFAKVQPQSSGRFKIITPTAVVGIKGTEFSVLINENNASEVKVFEGEVEMIGWVGEQQWVLSIPAGQTGNSLSSGGQGILKPNQAGDNKEWENFEKDDDQQKAEEEKKKAEEKKEAEEKAKEDKVKEEKAQQGSIKNETSKKEESKQVKSIKTSDSGNKNWSMDAGMGALNLDGVMYYRFALQPVFKIGKLKAALNLSLTWNDTNGLKNYENEDWLNLILYLQWAEKGDQPVYARLGSLEAATLGNGLIINRYSNLTPKAYNNGYHNLGVEFDLDLKRWGFETILNNVLDPSLAGVRLFVRPINFPFLDNLVIGASYATDFNTGPFWTPYLNDTITQDISTQIWGADIGLPIIGKYLRWYADFAQILNHGNGYTTGVKGDVWLLYYRAEYRNIEADFVPGYFNNYYEFSKPLFLNKPTSGERLNGYLGELGLDIMGFANIGVYYEDSLNNGGGSSVGYPLMHGQLTLNSKLFETIIKQRISAGLSYDQRNLNSPLTTETAIWEGKLLYGISSNVDMIYIYNQRYDNGQPVRTSSIQTQIHF